MDILENEKERFAKELGALQKTFHDIKQFEDYGQVKHCATQTTGLKDRIDGSLDQLKSFNEREAIFKQPISEYHDLDQLQLQFDPFFKLWEYCIEFDIDKQDWALGPFLKLSHTLIDKKIDTYLKNTVKLSKMFLDQDEPCKYISA